MTQQHNSTGTNDPDAFRPAASRQTRGRLAAKFGEPTPHLALIGAGASAALVVHRLTLMAAELPAGRLTVFDRGEFPRWRGRTFQPDRNEIVANAPLEYMSLQRDDPDHITHWMRRRGYGEFTNKDWPDWSAPRALIGEYFADCTTQNLETLSAHGWSVEIARDTVADIQASDSRLRITTELGKTVLADCAILCVGGEAPVDHYRSGPNPGFIQDPYPLAHTAEAIPRSTCVGVLGSGLTAVDVVAALHGQGHEGPIVLASRTGTLPNVRQRPPKSHPQALTAERIEVLARPSGEFGLRALLGLVDEELATIGSGIGDLLQELNTGEPAAARIRRQLDNGDKALSLVQYLLPAIGQEAWRLLRHADKNWLLHERYRLLMALCCAMQPQNGALMAAMLDSGQLRIEPGLESVTQTGKQDFLLRTQAHAFSTNWLFNASGLNRGTQALSSSPQPFESIFARKLATRHPLGGAAVRHATSQLIAEDASSPPLYALGEITSGSFFFTFGITVLATRATDIVRAIADRIQSGQLSHLATPKARPAPQDIHQRRRSRPSKDLPILSQHSLLAYELNKETGFLPATDPLWELPAAFADWEQLSENIPELLRRKSLRQSVHDLRYIDSRSLSRRCEHYRAFMLCALLATAYVMGEQPQATILPRQLALPLQQTADMLTLPPVLNYAALVLHNWSRINVTGSLDLDNLTTLRSLHGSADERWFFLNMTAIEAAGGPAVAAMADMARATTELDTSAVESNLGAMAVRLADMTGVLARLPEVVDPGTFYHQVRPMLNSWPEPVVYSGVSSRPRSWIAASGAQCALLQAFDATLGIRHTPQEKHALRGFRRYMPAGHRRFLSELESMLTVRDFIDGTPGSQGSLRDAYNDAIDKLTRFRKKHVEIAVRYIAKEAKNAGENVRYGTSGTEYLKFLHNVHKNTSAHELS
jgi:indoleamine 2,3-dioxygenase